ncbi:MAG: acyl-CoA dehydrogenase [Bacteroidetes bacterium]|nr:MAG: acyl-CoA dehydrogenase [Bacteroidota bacterium]
MNEFLTDRLKAILPKFNAILNDDIFPIEDIFLRGDLKNLQIEISKIQEKVKSSGLWAPHLEEKDGGLGLTLLEFAHISELLGKSPYGHYCFNCQAPDIGNMELMHTHASDALKEKYLAPLMKGEIRSCFAMTEPDRAGSNPVIMDTTAVKDGDDYLINGHKWFTSSADGAAFTIVMANTNPEADNKYKRASMIIVPLDNPGYKLVRNIPVMGETGEGYFSHAEVKFENCRVPQSNLIGTEGEGFTLAQERLGPGRIHHCMRWIGICERAFDMMCKRAVSRELSPGVTLASKQSVQNWIAESRAEINAARFMVLHTAKKIDLEGAKAARIEISTIKFFVADILLKVLDRSIQTHGALGLTEDTVLSYWYRHERGARIYDGPDEVHKAALARRILKDYKE